MSGVYTVSVRCVDTVQQELEKSIFAVEVDLNFEMNLNEVANLIADKISGDCNNYKVQEFCIDQFVFAPDENQVFGEYAALLQGFDNDDAKLEAYCVFYGTTKGAKLQDIDNEEASETVQYELAEGVLTEMKRGLAIIANCPNCKQVLKQIPLYKGRTASFNLRQTINCPKCGLELTDLDGPCFFNCEYKFKGEKADQQLVDKDWRTVPANQILFWKEDQQNQQQISNIIEWNKLQIFVKVLDSQFCKACQQRFNIEDEDDDEDVFETGPCGHRYHPSCLRDISKNGGRCVVPGCGQNFRD